MNAVACDLIIAHLDTISFFTVLQKLRAHLFSHLNRLGIFCLIPQIFTEDILVEIDRRRIEDMDFESAKVNT